MKQYLLAVVVVFLAGVTAASADYADPWSPDWSAAAGYTAQFWGLHAESGGAPVQPLAPDNFANNPFGTAGATWDTHPSGFYGWLALATGSHPAWVDEVWGGMVQMTGGTPIHLNADVPTGADSGTLRVVVQYDWYVYGGVSASVAGATDVTPAGYYDYVIGVSGSSRNWVRTTRVFELAANPGSVDVTLTATGFAPIVDSFSVITALDAPVSANMPVPEPSSLLLLGALALLRRSGH